MEIIIHTPQSAVELTASGGGTPSNTSPAYAVSEARFLVFTVIHNLTGSNSTSLDAIIYASHDGTTFDTEPYASLNIGANKVKTIPVSPGIYRVKIKVQNNDAANATKVTTKLTLSK